MTLDEALGFDLAELGAERAFGRVAIDDRHLQPLGVVHGGVYAALAESLASHADHGRSLGRLRGHPHGDPVPRSRVPSSHPHLAQRGSRNPIRASVGKPRSGRL